MSHHTAEHRTQEMNACIENCTRCHGICLETMNYCLSQGGIHAEPDHILLLDTCADICRTSAAAMLRGAAIHKVICGACAEVCRQCAESCQAMGEDAEMKRCAEICRRCAHSCSEMAGGL